MVVLSYTKYVLSQETKHADLNVFFNIQFDRAGNPNTNMESISVNSVAPTHSISRSTPITKKKKQIIIY